MKDIGWPHAVIAVVILVIVLTFLGHSFGVIELPGVLRIEMTPPPRSTPSSSYATPPNIISIEQAIRDYYALIQQGQYNIAWEMSEEYNRVKKGLSFEKYVHEWEKSGSATIVEPMRVEEVDGQATVTLTLYYPKKDATHVIRYEFTRDAKRGSQRFGYWIFTAGEMLQ